MESRFTAGRTPARAPSTVSPAIARERRHSARNYEPLPVVLTHGDGCWLWDEHGRRYLDMMSAYSAVSHGHAHPRIVRALVEQAQRLAVTSRVFHNELLPAFLQRLTVHTGLDRALPSSGGAEAVETALKAARKWGYKIKGIPADRAEVIVCSGNFHGRSITIVGFSSEPQYRDGFGPFPAGFRQVPFGDADALARAIGPNTAAQTRLPQCSAPPPFCTGWCCRWARLDGRASNRHSNRPTPPRCWLRWCGRPPPRA